MSRREVLGRTLFTLLATLALLSVSPGKSEAQTNCNTCEENYHNCLIQANQAYQDCRRGGGDEWQCSQGLQTAEQQCQDERTQCWAFCDFGSGSQPPPPPSGSGYCWTPPYGVLESIGANGVVTGYAGDTDIGDTVGVYFWIDGDPQTGLFAGATDATIPRPDLGYTGPPYGPRGFSFTIPQAYRNGQPHTLYADVRNSCGSTTFIVRITDPPVGFLLYP